MQIVAMKWHEILSYWYTTSSNMLFTAVSVIVILIVAKKTSLIKRLPTVARLTNELVYAWFTILIGYSPICTFSYWWHVRAQLCPVSSPVLWQVTVHQFMHAIYMYMVYTIMLHILQWYRPPWRLKSKIILLMAEVLVSSIDLISSAVVLQISPNALFYSLNLTVILQLYLHCHVW